MRGVRSPSRDLKNFEETIRLGYPGKEGPYGEKGEGDMGVVGQLVGP